MTNKKKSVNLLPEYLQTDKNAKFLSATLDQLINTPELERINGFIGSKITPNYNPTVDFYLKESLSSRLNYSLEPALVFKDNTSKIVDAISYDDLVNEIKVSGGNVDNLDNLFRTKFYSYDPLIDWDKLINYNQYYWLPSGPEVVVLSNSIDVETDILGKSEYITEKINSDTNENYKLTNGLAIKFINAFQDEYNNKVYIVEGVGKSIKLVDYSLLDGYEPMSRVLNETFDSNRFDDFPFDSDRRLPIDPEYITINRASNDLNPWSRYNRWFHEDIIKISSEINGIIPQISIESRAKRPIIEFIPNLQLFNFGKQGSINVDLIDNAETNAFVTINGSAGFYIDGILVTNGQKVIFNSDIDENVKGKIYKVTFTTGISPVVQLIEHNVPNDLDSVSVKFGNKYAGTSWFYQQNTNKWKYSQQHNKLNQPPLFELYDIDGNSYSSMDIINNFTGNKVFGYDIGTGTNDDVLGFPLKYQNSVGVGSYLFKNYFMTDSISILDNKSQIIPTSITYLKIYNDNNEENLINVWKEAVEYKIPVVETQIIQENTTTLQVTCLNKPIKSLQSVTAYLNDVKIGESLTDIITLTQEVTTNQLVVLKILTNDVPNSNGYYETPLSLTNNPLNGSIINMTLSELADHVTTMNNRNPDFTGNNLKDLQDYSKFGTRLIISTNPISFSQLFLGKQEHNVVDALRYSALQYNRFKSVLFNKLATVDSQDLPNNILDNILKEVNLIKTQRSPYYRSDMLGYGDDKTVRSFVVESSTITEYYIGVNFDLSTTSFQSILVYLNNNQLIVGQDYTFDKINESILFDIELNQGDILDIHIYSNTLASYVPLTPTKLGLYPSFVPEIYIDDSYVSGPVTMIRGHDGSIIKAFDDYRDDVILEFEKRIFNNLKVQYNSDIFDITSVLPGAFRENKLSVEQTNDILIKDFTQWSGINNIDVKTNTSFDEGNPFTWNFKNTVDLINGNSVNGTWRSVYRYFFDTERPHTHPWEMLGHTSKPLWWDTYYSWTDTVKRNNLINSLENGFTKEPPSEFVNLSYKREGITDFIPVDLFGNLKSPDEFLVTENGYLDKKSNWVFGDISPAETVWRRSSYWPFVLNILSVLTSPCDYTSRLYDVSRIKVNSLNQITYTNDDLYLDPRKILIDGENDVQVVGYGTLVVEKGNTKNINYIQQLRQDINYLSINLFHKLGGFTSKNKIQITIDSIDPVSASPGVDIPAEDYSLILNVSNPIKTARISGIIVQKSNGKFVVKGYDTSNPYFEIFNPIKTSVSGSLTVGGVSEKFVDWASFNLSNVNSQSIDNITATSNTTKYYKQGQIVRYKNKFYRVKVGHTAQSIFDESLYVMLPTLPIKGGVTVQISSNFEKNPTRIPYGTEFSTIQEVYDLIVGYGAFLEDQGFIFDEHHGDLGEILNWKFSGKEFLYWTTQNWADGNLITLSPFANKLKYSFTDSIVDNIKSGKYEYSLLKSDGKSYPAENVKLIRDDGVCSIETLDDNEGLFFAVLHLIQKEHAFVFNNSTIFNDTIYDLESGYKQRRMKLTGFRTKNWNGDLFSPGFVYDSVNYSDWQKFVTYNAGDVVRYNGNYYQSLKSIKNDPTFDFSKWVKLSKKPEADLLPNFDYKISQFEDFYSLDIDNFDSGQQELAQHLIGYTPRTYLNNIFSNPISQYKFYQGFIKEKGTKNVIDKLSKIGQFTNKGTIELNEEWAFRIGNYGSYSSFREIEFTLNEGTFLENPYLIKFLDSIPNNKEPLINYVVPQDLVLKFPEYVSTGTFLTVPGTFAENNIELLTAGYVNPNDVTATAYGIPSLLDIANNNNIQQGNTFWLGFLDNGSWTVYRYLRKPAKISGVFVSAPGENITFVTDKQHNLNVDDIVSIVNFNDQVNGVYKVLSIPSLKQFSVKSSLTSIENEELLSYGSLYKFDEVRYSDLKTLISVPELIYLNHGDKFWVDNGVNNKWQVYEKIKNYSAKYIESNDYILGQQLGKGIFASDNTNIMLVSAPTWNAPSALSAGMVQTFVNRNNEFINEFNYTLNDKISYVSNTQQTEFGFSLNYDIDKGLYFAGAPAASNVIYIDNPGNVIISTGTGSISIFDMQGVVKISSKNNKFKEETPAAVLISPFAVSNERFGNSIYINQVDSTTSTLMIVGAPGTGDIVGNAYAYLLDYSNNVKIISHPSGIKVSSPTVLNTGSLFGHVIVGNDSGSIIAISAPEYKSQTRSGIVQIFSNTNNVLTHWYNIDSPLEGEFKTRFGYSMAITGDGEYLVISAPGYKKYSGSYGVVFLYKLNADNIYELYQTIENPVQQQDIKFGYSVSIDKNKETIVVGALGVNRSNINRFDIGSDIKETVFDAETTRFVDPIPDSGEVYIFDKVGDYFIPADELSNNKVKEGSNFGISVVATNDIIFVGAPSTLSTAVTDDSKLFIFERTDKSSNSWKVKYQQEDLIDISKIKKVVLLDNYKEEVVEYLDVIDPVKGKIAGIADQELKFKSAFDPAIYSIGSQGTVNDVTSNWIDDHVGDLWWDLSTSKFIWYEQGSDIFRKNNWGKLFPGASIDVYEWVKSDLLPSEWAAQADTNVGLTKGISGQPRYPNNNVISVKQVYNNVTNAYENVYYYWVKNKVTVPNVQNRRISAYQVASLILDPIANGLKFVEFLSKDSIAFANVQPLLNGNKINANISYDTIDNKIPKHTEWLLLNEGNGSVPIPSLLEKKLIDSLLGHDSLGNDVPDKSLTDREKYGIGIRPRQSLFKNRLEAIRNVISFSNFIFTNNRITDVYSFDNLTKREEIPNEYDGEYDFIVEDNFELKNVKTVNFSQAIITCSVNNGKIENINIVSPGYGYTLPPKIMVNDVNKSAKFRSILDGFGRVVDIEILNAGNGYVNPPLLEVRPHSVVVNVDYDINNKWTINYFDYNLKTWKKVRTQLYDTSLVWKYQDWSSYNFDKFKTIKFVVDNLFDLSSLSNISVGDYVKVKNNGANRYLILERVNNNGDFILNYNIVYDQNGTIQLLDNLWNNENNYYDATTLDETLFDQSTDIELYNVIQALKNDIFVEQLKNNWNLLFFVCVKFALTEQKLLDWAFKTSFINVINNAGSLDQRSVYKLDNEEFFEQYIREVKPYRSNIRNYKSVYDVSDTFSGDIADFDLPSYYNSNTNKIESLEINTLNSKSEIIYNNEIVNTYPWKHWIENYTYNVEKIEVADGGTYYTQKPIVTLITAPGDFGVGATAEAFIKSGSVFKIVVTNKGHGYVIPPLIVISGGGSKVVRNATASVILSNNTVRKNKIGVKFDRVSRGAEIDSHTVVDTFICDGTQNSFVLSWFADIDKSTIVPTLDGRLILSSDYRIEEFKEKSFGYTKNYSKFVFLNEIPEIDQRLIVRYQKNISIYTAIDRIEKYYSPSEDMVGKEYNLLMTGLEYPQTQITGLKFEDTPPWDTTPYDSSPWGDLLTSFAETNLVNPIYTNSSTIYLKSVNGIQQGQTISVISTGTIQYFKPNTVVESVNNLDNTVNIFLPKYIIKKVKANNIDPGSIIEFTTVEKFNTGIKQNDLIKISNVSPNEFNGEYQVTTCTNNKFKVLSLGGLSTTTGVVTTTSNVEVYAVLNTVPVNNNVVIYKIVEKVSGQTEKIFNTPIFFDDISDYNITFSEVGPLGSISTNGQNPPKTNIELGFLNPGVETTVTVEFYGRTTLEFYGNNTDYSSLDSAINGGTWQGNNLVDALGIEPEDIIIDGDKIVNPNSSYAPEELVPGYVVDSLGINVFTHPGISSPLVMSIIIPIIEGQVTRYKLPYFSDTPIGIIISYNGMVLEKVGGNDPWAENQFAVQGDTIVIYPQTVSGKAFCTLMFVGANTQFDSGLIFVQNEIGGINFGKVTCSLSYNDIKSVYVTLNGIQISEYNGTGIGYILEPTSNDNNRASVKVILPNDNNKYTIEAWFFKTLFPEFNRFIENRVDIVTTTTSIVLNNYFNTIGVESLQSIVEISDNSSWIRLRPPSASYYVVNNIYAEYDVDNKSNESIEYTVRNVKVYLNGYDLRPGFDWNINSINKTVKIKENILTKGDQVAIVVLMNYDYLIQNGVLYLTQPVTAGKTVKITSFSESKNLYIKTERFKVNAANEYKLSLPVMSENFVWVNIGSQYLSSGYDFGVLSDMRTIHIYNWVPTNQTGEVIIMTMTPPMPYSGVVGYRIFKDIFENQSYKRLSDYYSSELERPLTNADTAIYLKSGIGFFSPSADINLPGVVLINGERIEYLTKAGNMLTDLRRGTLGTGVITYSPVGTKVFDQSIRQTVNTVEQRLQQNLFTNTNTVVISTTTVDTIFAKGDGILLYTPTEILSISSVDNLMYVSLGLSNSWLRKGDVVSLENIQESYYNGNFIVDQLLENKLDILFVETDQANPSVITVTTKLPHCLINGNIVSVNSTEPLVTGNFTIYDVTPYKFKFIAKNQLNEFDLDNTTRAVTNVGDISINVANSGGRMILLSNSTSTFGNLYGTILTSSTAKVSVANAINQVEVYYGGRQLRKTSMVIHDSNKSYYDTNFSVSVLEPEFSIDIATQELTLNIKEDITDKTRITVVQRKGAIWTTASILASESEQTVFLRNRPTSIPDNFYYGKELDITDATNEVLFDNNGDQLQGF